MRQRRHSFLSQYSFFSWMRAWLSPAFSTTRPHCCHILTIWLFSAFSSSRKSKARSQNFSFSAVPAVGEEDGDYRC